MLFEIQRVTCVVHVSHKWMSGSDRPNHCVLVVCKLLILVGCPCQWYSTLNLCMSHKEIHKVTSLLTIAIISFEWQVLSWSHILVSLLSHESHSSVKYKYVVCLHLMIPFQNSLIRILFSACIKVSKHSNDIHSSHTIRHS